MIEGGRAALSRERVLDVALELVQREGLEALTMRGLADRLGVRAASLYWHVRDRGELVALLAERLLGTVRPSATDGGWRERALAICSALERMVAERRDAARMVLEVPEALERSQPHRWLRSVLEEVGLPAAEAREVTTMMLTYVLVGGPRVIGPPAVERGRPVLLAIDAGSRGVHLRAGSGMTGLVRMAHDPTSAVPALIQGHRVVVRRLRGVRPGELELNPAYPWRVRVQAPTWGTFLDLSGLDLREIHIDSGAARVECVLPRPRGVVPIHVSSGVVGVRLRRPPGVPVVAEISAGALQLKLDAFSVRAATGDARWESVPGAGDGDHHRLRISSGAVRVTLEEDPSITARPVEVEAAPPGGLAAALNVVLDGVARRATT
jgi:AcrR family transcriptional regulator